ncbi:MATE family efflux transporter [Halosimplex halobium]|uniref:MATE family efflux transporter n=1 Tax=Halosimplex halobium TaxID=3396618 RepID=UPI003F56976E
MWKRVVSLSWPIAAQSFLRTGMRTTDILVTGLISPAAISAIGIANLFTQFPLFLGIGLGSGSMALTSQDTGRGSVVTRDRAISTACTMALALGLPFALFGLYFAEAAMALVGPPTEVIRTGGLYLSVVLLTAPARQVTLVVARALQGTGDTLTPMYIRGVTNVLNIAGTVGLGLGVGSLPRLGVFGVGLATASANVLAASIAVGVVVSDRTEISFVRPNDVRVAIQVVIIAAPRAVQGFTRTAADFPLNAILLTFGVNVNAGYHVSRRVFQQVSAPVARSFSVVTSIVVGQAVGERDPGKATFLGRATVLLGLLVALAFGLVLYVGATPLARVFSDEPETVSSAAFLIRAWGLSVPFGMVYRVLAGALEGGSETRIPFLANLTGLAVCMLGIPYVGGIVLGYGITAVAVAIVTYNVWRTALVGLWFERDGWLDRADRMMDARDPASGD